MNKLFTKIATAMVGIAMAVGVGVAVGSGHETKPANADSGDEYTFSATSGTSTDTKWSFASAKNSGSTAPTFNGGIRLYPANSITFTGASNIVLNSASFNCTVNANKSGTKPTGYSVDNGSLSKYSNTQTSFTWTGGDSDTSFTITIAGSAGNLQLNKVTMNYTNNSTASVESVTLEVSSASINGGLFNYSNITVTPTVNYDDETTNHSASIKVTDTNNYNASASSNATFSNGKLTFSSNTTVYVWGTSIDDNSVHSSSVAVTASNLVSGIELNATNLSIPSSYGNFNATVGGASFVGNGTTTNNKDYIQIRDQTPSGLVVSSTAGLIKYLYVEVDHGENNFYINAQTTTAYTDASDLYSAETRGSSLGTFNSTTGVIDLTSQSYQYFGIKGAGAVYLSKVIVSWETVKPTSITLNGDSAVSVGGDISLTPTLVNSSGYVVSDTALTWESSDEDIATVDNGTVHGVASGSATITAKLTSDNTIYATKVITVSSGAISVSSVTIDETKTIYVDQDVEISSTILPANATDKALVWTIQSASPAGCATVENGVVTGVAAGTATVRATAHDGSGYYDECVVTINEKVYVDKVTSVTDLWDGQQVYLVDATASYVALAYSSGNYVTSEEATLANAGSKFSVTDATSAYAYRVGKFYDSESDEIQYTFSYVANATTYYLYCASTGSNGYLKGKTTLDDLCYWTVSISDGQAIIENVGARDLETPLTRRYMYFNASHGLNSITTGSKVSFYAVTTYDEDTVADKFVENYMHMDLNVSGQCNTYYPIAKRAWNALSDDERLNVSVNHDDAYDRLEAWAAAKGDKISDSDMSLVVKSVYSDINTLSSMSKENSATVLIIIISVVGVVTIGGYFFLRRRKED